MDIQIFTGETLRLAVTPQTSIATVKARLRDYTGVPLPLQLVVADGRVLQDQQRAQCITENTTLRLDLTSRFRVRLLLRTSKGLVPVEVLVSDTLRAVREAISEPAACFAADGELLAEDLTVAELLRTKELVLHVLKDHTTPVHMNTHCYKAVYAEREDSSRVVGQLQAASNSFLVSLCPCERCTACSSQLQSGASAQLTDNAPTPEFYVWVKAIGADVKRLTISPFSPVAELAPWVLLCGRPLDPAALVRDAGVQAGATLEVGETLLRVCTQNVQHLKVAVARTLSVETLKRELESRLCVLDTTLALDGVVLSDKQDFSGCGAEATIEVVQQSDRFVWVKCEEERVAVSLPDAPYTADSVLRLFQAATGTDLQSVWLLHAGQLVSPGQSITLQSGSTLEVHSQSKQLVTVVTSSGKWVVAINATDRIAMLEHEFRKHGMSGQFLADGQKVSTDFAIASYASRRIVLLGKYERLFTFRYHGTEVALPFNLSSTVERVKLRLQEEFLLSPGLVLVQQGALSDYSVIRHLSSDTIDVFQLSDVFLWIEELGAPRRCVSVPTLSISVSEFLALCNFPEPMLLFHLKFLSEPQLLRDHGLRAGATITAVPRSRFTLDVSVGTVDTFLLAQRANGESVLVRYSCKHSLRDVEKSLCAALKCDRLIFVHGNRVLAKDDLRALMAGTTVKL